MPLHPWWELVGFFVELRIFAPHPLSLFLLFFSASPSLSKPFPPWCDLKGPGRRSFCLEYTFVACLTQVSLLFFPPPKHPVFFFPGLGGHPGLSSPPFFFSVPTFFIPLTKCLVATVSCVDFSPPPFHITCQRLHRPFFWDFFLFPPLPIKAVIIWCFESDSPIS